MIFMLSRNSVGDLWLSLTTMKCNTLVTFALQVTSESDVKKAVQKLTETFGPVSAALTTVATLVQSGTLSDTGQPHSMEQFEKVLKV